MAELPTVLGAQTSCSRKLRPRPRPSALELPSTSASPASWLVSDSHEVPARFKEPPSGIIVAIFFDFDGTLTSTKGEHATWESKHSELSDRAAMLEPVLRGLRDAGISLCVISKSTEATIRSALDASGLLQFFDGPLRGSAVGFEGKAGLIKKLATPVHQILLVDDDVAELERARECGLQVYASPTGGLQKQDLEIISQAAAAVSTPAVEASRISASDQEEDSSNEEVWSDESEQPLRNTLRNHRKAGILKPCGLLELCCRCLIAGR